MRDLLASRQANLCCYCERDISHLGERAKIEHFRPQRHHAHLDLVWSNLWAVCDGNQGMPSDLQHCDTRKGDRRCDLDPAAIVDAQITYRPASGEIRHTEPTLNEQMEVVLNLNCERLRKARQQALLGLVTRFSRDGTWPRSVLQRKLAGISVDEPFGSMLRYWLRHKLERAN